MDILDPVIVDLSQFALIMAQKSTRCLDTQDELYQLCMLRIFKVWEEYPDKPDEERVKLAKRSICNQISDYWRHEGKTVEAVRAYREIHRGDYQVDLGESEPEPAAVLDTRADRLVQSLPAKLRAVYALRADGAPVAKIAEILGIKLRMAHNYVRRLKETLKRGLASSQEK